MFTKTELRKQIKAARDRLTDQEKRQKDVLIAKKILRMQIYRDASEIYLYAAFFREAGTDLIFRAAAEAGKTIYYPKVVGTEMEFYGVEPEEKLPIGYMGIREPSGKGKDPAAVSRGVMIVPGVAFDVCCNRVGYGKGFYDRFLRGHPGPVTVGLAYEFQIFDRIETNKDDVALDYIVTEQKIYQRNEEGI